MAQTCDKASTSVAAAVAANVVAACLASAATMVTSMPSMFVAPAGGAFFRFGILVLLLLTANTISLNLLWGSPATQLGKLRSRLTDEQENYQDLIVVHWRG